MLAVTLSSPGAIFIKLGAVTIRWYGVMIAAGFLVATWAGGALAKRRNIDPDKLINGSLIAFMAGILGARLYYVALSWERFALHPEEIFATWLGGLSLHGGIIGGVLGAAIYCKMTRVSFRDGMDIAGAVLPLAQAIGRWGNFFNSEAFGKPVPDDFPLRLFIPPESRPAEFESYEYFHATFLYESIWNFLIFLVLYFMLFDKLRAYPGMTFLAYVFLYSIGRFLIEPLRTDSIMLFGLPAPSVVSGVLIVVSALAIAVQYALSKKKRNLNS
jgi:phosphatidylglycerol:prolipoprotein diacylglycerol transferase